MFTQISPSPATLSTTTSPVSPTTPSRTGRLRGLSYLRSYTHNHLHFTQSSASVPSPQPLSRSISYPAPVPTTTDSRNATSDTAQSGPIELSFPSPERSTTDLISNQQSDSSPSTSGWLPTVGGLSGLSRVATRPQPTAAAPPSAELSGNITATVAQRTRSMGRSRSGSAPQGPRGAALVPGPFHSSRAAEFASLDGPASLPPPATAPASSRLNIASTAPAHNTGASSQGNLPTIRFIPHHDPRAARPSLVFGSVSRTLPDGTSVIRVGRYSERDSNPNVAPNAPSAAPVGFKSKVVSRRHCEFWCSNGQWYIKDVRSSSGTFLNHIRLSQAGLDSKPWPVNDGDVVQLGIDFRGGEEMIFRCVKIRVECNRGWQKALNNFNMTTHKQLRNMTKTTNSKSGDTASTHSSECSICLMSIAPCQSLFVAPCSHVWHYKCIRPILNGQTWPQFLCPNCRAVADLEADVDDPAAYEAWEEENDGVAEPAEAEEVLPDSPRASTGSQSESESARRSMAVSDSPEDEVMNLANDEVLSTMMGSVALAEQRQSSEAERSPSMYETAESPILPHSPPSSSSLSRRVPSSVGPLNIAQRKSSASRKNSNPTLRARNDNTSQANQLVAAAGGLDSPSRAASSAELLGPEGPMTPRNDAGPFVFDGSAGRNTGRRIAASLGEIAVESAPTQ